jgi:hypothetical protein
MKCAWPITSVSSGACSAPRSWHLRIDIFFRRGTLVELCKLLLDLVEGLMASRQNTGPASHTPSARLNSRILSYF